ncbi:uncharacterized protein TNCV_1804241 [Trichonephila clavipes]|nr:uncharacterized protein TNCV_1804241 [Trichonephila clavipes]
MVFAATTYKSLGLTDLTIMYSVYTRRVFGGVGDRTQALRYTRALATDHVILNHGQVTWTTPELVPPLLTTTPHQWEDISALGRFKVIRCPIRWVFSGTGHELVTAPGLESSTLRSQTRDCKH